MRNEYRGAADEWLKINDPLYGDRKKSGYLTKDMSDWADRHELPAGNNDEVEHKSKSKAKKRKGNIRNEALWTDQGNGNYRKKGGGGGVLTCHTDWALLNYADYTNHKRVKNLIMRMDHLHTLGAYRGNDAALCIYIDLKTAINTDGVLTNNQRECLQLLIEGYLQQEIAEMMKILKSAVSTTISRAAGNISKHLEKSLKKDTNFLPETHLSYREVKA